MGNEGAAGLTSADQRVIALLDGPVPRGRHSPLYLLGLLLVTLAMVILPLIYLALIAAIGYAVYWHAVHDLFWLGGRGAALLRFKLVAYLGPIVAGSVLVFFMLKPFFARPARQDSGLKVTPEQEPLLFAFVARLCRLVGAPVPREIVLDCDVNASAGFRRGWLSMLGSDLRLTLGLPLVAGLSLPQLAGVLAHEFGHFTQGSAMRLNYVVRSINAWFYYVVYERDSWDAALAGAYDSESAWVKIVAGLTGVCVWLTRRILWVLMYAGHALSCFLMRQMEYDADRYEAHVAGSATFAATSHRLSHLGAAAQAVYHHLEGSWRERRLPNNLPHLISAREATMSAAVREKIDAHILKAKTGWFDTHPSSIDRIESVERLAAPGVIHGDQPATVLFRSFDKTCQALSFVFYRDVLGEVVQPGNLVDTGQFVGELQQQAEERQGVETYLGVVPSPARPLRLAVTLTPPPDPRKTVATVREAGRRMKAAREKVAAAYLAHFEATNRLIQLARIEGALRMRVTLRASDCELSDLEPPTRAAELKAAQQRRDEAARTLAAFEHVAQVRLGGALSLLTVPALARKLPEAPTLRKEVQRLTATLRELDPALTDLVQQRTAALLLEDALRVAADEPDSTAANAILEGQTRSVAETLRARRMELRDAPYPFAHAQGMIPLANHLVAEVPPEREPADVLAAFGTYEENLAATHAKLLGRLVAIAVQVEGALTPAPAAAVS